MRRALVVCAALSLTGSAPAAQAPTTLAFTGTDGVYLTGGGRPRLLAQGAADPAWSPDGRRVAYVAPGLGGATDLFVVDADRTNRGKITWTDGVDESSPSWSPDGKRLVVERSGEIVTLRADGSGERVLATGMQPAWSPGGRRIAYSDGDDLFVASVRNGTTRRLASTSGFDTAPAWSPDGRRVAFVSEEVFSDLYVLVVSTGAITRLTTDLTTEASPAFTAHGRQITFVSNRTGVDALWRVPANGGTAVRLAAGLVGSDPAVRPQPRTVELLPDLEQRPPADLSIKTVIRRGRTHFLLGFDSATDNVGLGPVIISAQRPNRRANFMSGSQIVRLAGGGRRTEPRVGVLRYVYSPTHSHWHVLGFQRYELRRASDNSIVLRDRKSGFCLADHWAHAPGRHRNEPRAPVFKGYCERSRPDALSVYQGTSVGYTDRYPSHFHGQNLDLTGAPAGEYVLVHRANRNLLFRELRYENNAAAVRIRLSWPHGHSQPPALRVLRTCPDSQYC